MLVVDFLVVFILGHVVADFWRIIIWIHVFFLHFDTSYSKSSNPSCLLFWLIFWWFSWRYISFGVVVTRPTPTPPVKFKSTLFFLWHWFCVPFFRHSGRRDFLENPEVAPNLRQF